MSEYLVPLSLEDEYILETFDNVRLLRAFNNGLRGIVVPVNDHNETLHDNVLFDIDAKDSKAIAHAANQFQMRSNRRNARVLYVQWSETRKCYEAGLEWLEETPVPKEIRVTACLKGKRCIRVMQFGV